MLETYEMCSTLQVHSFILLIFNKFSPDLLLYSFKSLAIINQLFVVIKEKGESVFLAFIWKGLQCCLGNCVLCKISSLQQSGKKNVEGP